jgi:hypothetical protein
LMDLEMILPKKQQMLKEKRVKKIKRRLQR